MDTGTLNFAWSQHLIGGLVAAGVTHAVASPGSRSTPLTLALLRQPGLSVEMAVDERSAAFFALGLAKASRRPVILVATSGTAVANWLPAAIEASQGGMPLILISADRPPELQACGANQTIDQVDLFGKHVRASHSAGAPHEGFDPAWLHRLAARLVEQASWPLPGPVHLNQPFREPLLPAAATPAPSLPPVPAISHGPATPDAGAIAALAEAIGDRPGAIVCGELPAQTGFCDALTALSEQLDCPIFAEPLSGLRFGPHRRHRLLTRYNAWLGDTERATQARPEWILRFGAYPVTRHLQHYLAQAPIQALVDPWPRQSDPGQRLTHLLRADPLAACQALRAAAPAPAAAGWSAALFASEAERPDDAQAWHIRPLIEEAPADSALFIGNSLAIRQFDTYAESSEKPLWCYANRGASGIDGNVSTALGLAGIHGRVVALLGDLSCQHDLGGLALAGGRNAVFVVVNNGGGGIFDYLPQAALPEFVTGWRTPQQIDFSHAAKAFGLAYRRTSHAEAFRHGLREALQAGGPWLLEVALAG